MGVKKCCKGNLEVLEVFDDVLRVIVYASG